jgi:hypothetical protein|tara:strand:+ start:606 stop:1244 length:639 start_codon:yes stop_codon:yes gene_type:complete
MATIEDLKATISKKGGLARANRFRVIFTPPTQSLLNLNPQTIISSVISGNFSAKNLINDPRDIDILCDSVSIPGRQISTIDYAAEKQSVKIPYGELHDDITCTFLLTNDYYMKTVFDSWIGSIVDMDQYSLAYKKDITTDVIIQQLDEENTPIYGVKLEGAFPTTVNDIELSNESENTIQKLGVSFSYDKYVPEGPLSSTGSAIRSALSIFG